MKINKTAIVVSLVVFLVFIGSVNVFSQIKENMDEAKEHTVSDDIVELEISEQDPVVIPKEELPTETLLKKDIKTSIPQTQNDNSEQSLIKKCPEAWYVNKMPTVKTEGEVDKISEYLIIDGKRVELDEVDMAWMTANCTIQRKDVY